MRFVWLQACSTFSVSTWAPCAETVTERFSISWPRWRECSVEWGPVEDCWLSAERSKSGQHMQRFGRKPCVLTTDQKTRCGLFLLVIDDRYVFFFVKCSTTLPNEWLTFSCLHDPPVSQYMSQYILHPKTVSPALVMDHHWMRCRIKINKSNN